MRERCCTKRYPRVASSMPPRDHRDLSALLLGKAAADTAVIEQLLDNDEVPDDVIGFHAQQACEKLFKAVLAARQVRYRFTHDLAELADQVRDTLGSGPESLEDAVALTPFAVAYRYEDIAVDEEPLDRHAVLRLVDDLRRWADGVIG